MQRRMLIAPLIIAGVVACSPAPVDLAEPSASTGSLQLTTATAGPALVPTPAATQVPALVPVSDAGAYAQGDPVTIALDEEGAGAWVLPAVAPTFGDADTGGVFETRGFTLLPLDCPALGAYSITIDGQPFNPAPWDEVLRGDGTQLGSWPAAATPPSCLDGIASRYLEVGYQAFAAGAPIAIRVEKTEGPSEATVPARMTFVPVFTPVGTGTPYRTMTDSSSMGSATGAERALGSEPRRVFRTTYEVPATLPDGSTATHFSVQLTGCGPAGPKATHDLTITLVVGDAAPVELGWCSDSGIATANVDLPLPAAGTPLAVYAAGGTTRSGYRVSTFEWREGPAGP